LSGFLGDPAQQESCSCERSRDQLHRAGLEPRGLYAELQLRHSVPAAGIDCIGNKLYRQQGYSYRSGWKCGQFGRIKPIAGERAPIWGRVVPTALAEPGASPTAVSRFHRNPGTGATSVPAVSGDYAAVV